MRKALLVGMLVVVAVACGDAAGVLLRDAGQVMMDAGDGIAPDAGAQTGECVVGPTGPQGPPGPPGPPAAPMQFVGRTTDAFNGAQGVLTYSVACQTDFGPGHRMCTSEELLDTVDLPTLTGGPSWVRPTFVPAGGGSSAVFVDISGVSSASNSSLFACNGWISANSAFTGLTVDAGGSFDLLACNASRTVACCGPSS